MRKNIMAFMLAVTMTTILTACASKSNETTVAESVEESKSTMEATQETTQETTEEETREILYGDAYERIGITDEELVELIENNLYCYLFVFGENVLPSSVEVTYDVDASKYLYPVEATLYANYAEFEEYISSVYCKDEAKRLLSAYPQKNQCLYVNVDGQLYVDYRYYSKEEVTVDWFNYDFVVFEEAEDHCRFKLYTTKTTDKGEEDYEVVAEAVYENGNWVLKEMFY